VVFGITPAVYRELRPAPTPRDGTRSGVWLDAGFRVARWAGRMLVLGVMVVLPAFFIFEWTVDKRAMALWLFMTDWNSTILVGAATALGAGSVGLVVFGNRLKRVTLGMRGALDVLLDVDNYLRQDPRTATPRARIFARMSSLLRHVEATGYDSVVIIAHSQGTVITTDLLRFLTALEAGKTADNVPGRRHSPVHLFTMGSPLRQLYGLRSPPLRVGSAHARRCCRTGLSHNRAGHEARPDRASTDDLGQRLSKRRLHRTVPVAHGPVREPIRDPDGRCPPSVDSRIGAG
jgi:hypothetical protein